MPTISLEELQIDLAEEGLREEAWLELFYDLLYVAAMIKLGAVTKKAEADQIIYCALIFAILFTSWYQLQRYLSKYYRNNLAHVLLLFAQCASVSQICINLIGLKYVKKEIVEAKAISIGVLMSKTTVMAMYLYIIHRDRRKMREVKICIVGLFISILCHAACLGLDSWEPIFYLWWGSVVIELTLDVLSRLKFETINHDVEHHNAERLGCFTMVVLGESVIQLLLPDIELISESSTYRYLVAGLSGALVFNLAVLHFDKLPSLIHDKSDAERGASSLPPHNNKLRVIWTLLHLPMTFSMLLVGVSMKYMFDIKKSSVDTVWMLSLSVSAILTFFSFMRFLRQGFSGKHKRLVSYMIRFIVAVATALVPIFLPVEDMETYYTILPFTAVTSLFVLVDMRQHFKIVEKVEHTEKKRLQSVFEETGHLPEKYRKSIALPTSFSLPSNPASPPDSNGNLQEPRFHTVTDNPLAAIVE